MLTPGQTPINKIRNFCIIAHIDHGKSTLADRILALSGVLSERQMRDQYLDRMDIERERGITIKSQAVRLPWTVAGSEYVLNMIDTPGHVDFTYEVSRSISACESCILLVDAAQGIQAQTLANLYIAIENNLTIIPVLNKIDLPQADIPSATQELSQLVGVPAPEVLQVSAKTGVGVRELLDTIVQKTPTPQILTTMPSKLEKLNSPLPSSAERSEGSSTNPPSHLIKGENASSSRSSNPKSSFDSESFTPPVHIASTPARALIFDSIFDSFRGVITYIRLFSGSISHRDKIMMMSNKATHNLLELGVISPEPIPAEKLQAGEVGYIITGVKDVALSKVGDTITLAKMPASEALPGFQDPKPMVYSGLYPIDADDYPILRDALGKLKLNDAALHYEPETSVALGFGYRLGLLGLLHLEIVRERLEREFNLALISTSPNVEYQVTPENHRTISVTNPSEFPEGKILDVQEPMVKATIITPSEYIGPIMELCQARRGVLEKMEYLSPVRVQLLYQLPLAEIIFDFFDALKSRSKGFASLDYEPWGLQSADLVKVDILLQGEAVDAFSAIVHKDEAYAYGVKLVEKLKSLIPRQLFEIPVQAAVGSRIIARETIRAQKKDVLAKCYGGDVTRKRKLLEKQKAGKKRMKTIGRVDIPQEAFIAALSTGD
ncbi:MAG: translation elongation factor 4 [Bifidobacteriaceae bacterium]|jgi:GTP-binding protein LepA|nr:translation elongation factor 4 [Bifidobacteriaceae bacterium]